MGKNYFDGIKYYVNYTGM